MEVSVISVECIKPLSLSATTHDGEVKFKPFKLSMLDQFVPSIYSPLIYFYPLKPTHDGYSSVSSTLKASLSKTLDIFYPLSGRLNNNDQNRPTIIHDFHQGVPFVEARIHRHRLADFLNPPKLEFLNKLLPLEPCCLVSTDSPQVAIQLNTFDCGGIALGVCLHHRVLDGASMSAFLKTWAAAAATDGGRCPVMVHPDFDRASSVFPPIELSPLSLPQDNNNIPSTETRRSRPRRFVFDSDALSALKSISRSDELDNPSRTEVVCAFIWKHAMKAAVDTKSPQLVRFLQGVNIRSRMGQRLTKTCFGNLASTAVVSTSVGDGGESMKELVASLRKGVQGINEKYLTSISAEDWFADFTAEGEEESTSTNDTSEHDEFLTCSSWNGFGFNDFDFGLGNPIWTGLFGDASGKHPPLPCSSVIVLKEAQNNDGVEAWITLDKDVMPALELDPHFLKFATPNPPIFFN